MTDFLRPATVDMLSGEGARADEQRSRDVEEEERRKRREMQLSDNGERGGEANQPCMATNTPKQTPAFYFGFYHHFFSFSIQFPACFNKFTRVLHLAKLCALSLNVLFAKVLITSALRILLQSSAL